MSWAALHSQLWMWSGWNILQVCSIYFSWSFPGKILSDLNVYDWHIGLIAQLFFRSYQICTTTHCKLRSYFGLWESRNLLLILGVFHFWKLGKNSTNLNHHFSSIFKGTMAWISINTKLFQTQIWLEKWYENGEILHFVSSFELRMGYELGAVAWPVYSKYFEVN